MSNNAIAAASSRFIHDEAHKYGLMIQGLPTGIGKTYSNCDMMLDESVKHGLKFIMISEQNKNLEHPYRDLRKLATDKKGNYRWTVAEFESRVLWLKSNVDMFEQGYKDSMKYEIYDSFSKYGIEKEVLNNLLDARKSYRRAQNKHSDAEYMEQLYQAYGKAEAALRSVIHKKILKHFSGRDSKLRHIDNDAELRWIKEIYPVVHFRDYSIILMSDSKFTKTIDPLVNAPFVIWDETDLSPSGNNLHSQLRDHVIVIDEFDTFKKVLEDYLIEENAKEVDAIRAFRSISARLTGWKSLPPEMIEPSEWWENQRYSIEERFKFIIDRANKIKSDYRMQYLFKLFSVDSDGTYIDPVSSSFMFRDNQASTVGTAFTLKMEEGDRYNRILTGKNITDKANKIASLFQALDYYFDQLCRLVRDLAFNFKSNTEKTIEFFQESGKPVKYEGEERSGLINSVDSIIDAFDMDEDLAHYVRNKVLHNRLKSNNERRIESHDPIMYSKGFRYVAMKDAVNRQLQTHLSYTDYDTTPEFILRHMCEVTKVIGLSATGELESPFCNFSLSYLRDSGIYIHEYSPEDMTDLNVLIDSNNVGYAEGRADIEAQFLDVDLKYSIVSWEKIFDPLTAKKVFNRLGKTTEKEGEDYPELRYVRAVKAIEQFIEHDDIQSMLCFFSAHVKSHTGTTFHIEKMEYLIEQVALKHDVCMKVEWALADEPKIFNETATRKVTLMQITGDNFYDAKDDLFARLKEGEKILVISAYQTLAAGQNLQYPIPADLYNEMNRELVWVRSGAGEIKFGETEKDFDAIYLDEPTSIGPKIIKNDKMSLDKYLFYAEYADASNQIDLDEKKKQIGQAFMFCYTPQNEGHPKHFKDTDIYAMAKAQVIIQAIGRTDRTGWKRKKTYVFLDRQLEYGGTFALDKKDYGTFRSKIFDEVYDKVHEPRVEDEAKKNKLLMHAAVRKSHGFMGLIKDVSDAMFGGESGAIEEWETWRQFVLRYPTVPESMDGLNDIERRLFIYGYVNTPVPTNAIWFCQKEDFRTESSDGLEVSFTKPRKLKSEDIPKLWQTVSSDRARLEQMLMIDGVREFMEEEHYATEFEVNAKSMCPPLFRNIYMGALGEAVGKFLLEDEKHYGMEGRIQKMPNEYYEQFDFMFDTGAAIDFKDWSDRYMTEAKAKEYMLKKINAKMKRCKVDRVYVINVVVESGMKYQPIITEHVESGEIVIVPYLYQVGPKGNIFNDAFDKALRREVKQ